jgi:putative spermidine/putrescine transport system ATP-binding protein
VSSISRRLRPRTTSTDAPQHSGALELAGLTKRFGDVTAVDDVDLEVSAGEFVTLLGESGSGKTTTLLMIAGFEEPTAGIVLLDGADVTAVPPHRRNLGMVFQNYALFPHMTVRENIAFPLRRRRLARVEISERVAETLAFVNLAGYEDRYPHELSGGQQQRIAVARATVYRPPVLLMDEPLSALDKKLRQNLQGEIRRIHRELETTIVYVTHDQEEALALSDRIALMHDGRIEQVGTPQEVYERPRTLFAAGFLGEANLLRGHIVAGQANEVLVELTNGQRVGASTSTDQTQGPVVVVVRPERLLLADEGGDGLDVEIDELVYVGQSIRCSGRFDTGETCTLRLDADTGALIGGARRCRVRWDATHASIVPAGDSEAALRGSVIDDDGSASNTATAENVA